MFSTLRAKIFAGFTAIIAINVVAGMWAIYRFSAVGRTVSESLSAGADLAAQVMQLAILSDQQYELTRQISRSAPGPGRESLSSTFTLRSTDAQLLMTQIWSRTDSVADRNLIVRLRSQFEDFRTAAISYRDAMLGRNGLTLKAGMSDSLQSNLSDLKSACFELLTRTRTVIRDSRDRQSDELKDSLFVVAMATIIALVLSVIGGGIYSRWAVQPISRLTQAVKSLSGGQLGEHIRIISADELGDLTYEFNRMLERLRRYEAMNIEQLLLEKQKVETIVQSIATPILVADAGMNALLVNSAAADLFRLDVRNRYEGLPVRTLVNDKAVLASLQNAYTGNQQHPLASDTAPDIYVVNEEGRQRFYAIQTLPLKTSSSVSGVVAVFSDITHFKELDRLKSEFLAKVSHEFRTPLSSILMSLDILREGILGQVNDAQLDLLDTSKEDCRRLSKLIADLLELSRLESARRQPSLEVLNTRSSLESIAGAFRQSAQNKEITLNLDIAPDVPESLYADPEDLRWMLNNLIGNALAHTDSGGIITLTVQCKSGELLLRVTDTGRGIPLESQQKIFEKFYQVGNASISTPGSVGLGLAIVRDVAQSYGGRTTVTSQLGQGSAFTIALPLSRMLPAPSPDTSPEDTDPPPYQVRNPGPG